MSNSKAVAKAENTELATMLDAALNNGPASSDNVAFMKFAKGEWLFGADEDEVSEGSLWAVNPKSFCQGYIVWVDNEVEDEAMAQLGQPAPPVPAGGDAQVAFEMLCIEGPDKGTRVLFKTSSRGGRNGVMKLIKAVSANASAGEPCVPVVSLENDHYKHKEYGKIYTPVFNAERWINEADISDDAPEEADDVEDESDVEEVEDNKPARSRRRKRSA